ncbi:hypothetical protein PF011_g21881 [Phytophthora fragariae]|uniref:JmjC domain-containing protein n=1 Tax=Phytophthora fragariae TaxID=53985 RepID=A0A6A3IIG3_9STRA|nr:hypothetical protein PF011_g21881 [Phytophthora fragariae]
MCMYKFINDGVRESWDEGKPSPSDQFAVPEPEGYYSKIQFKSDKVSTYKTECWLQAGNRESPVHMDHGRVVSYIPPCAKNCFRIWVFFPQEPTELFKWRNKEDFFNRMLDATTTEVLIQRPGDVVYFNNLVHHSVLLGFVLDTAEEDKWGGIFGNVIVRAVDRIDSYNDDFDDIKESFKASLELPKETEKASKMATAKWDKRRKIMDIMEKVRALEESKQA